MTAAVIETRPELCWLPTDRLVIDSAYQREPSKRGQAAVARIAKAFSWSRFGALVVSRRDDGAFAVIDGQHRMLAARSIGLGELPCVVVGEATDGQARAFVGVNKDRIAVTKPRVWVASVAAGDPDAVRLHALLTSCGIRVEAREGVQLGPLATRSITALHRLVRQPGEVYLEDALDMLATGQPETPGLLSRCVIMATTHAVHRVRTAEGDLDRLAQVVRETEFDAVEDKAREVAKLLDRDAYLVAAGMLIKAYNHGQRSRLSEEF